MKFADDAAWKRVITLGDLFRPCAVLKVSSRLAVAAMTTLPGRSVPVLAEELAATELAVDHASWSALLQRIADGLPADVMAVPAVADAPLGDVLPWLALAPGDIDPTELAPRLVRSLDRCGARTWRALATTPLSEVAKGTRVGPAPLATLLRAAFLAAAQAAKENGKSGAPGPSRPERARPTVEGDLTLLLGRRHSSADLRLTLEQLALETVPLEARDAARRLLALAPRSSPPLSLAAITRPQPAALTSATRVLDDLGDLRDRIAFERLCLADDLRPNELAGLLEVGYESVRRSRQRAEIRARELAESDTELMALVEQLGDGLGVIVQLGAVEQALADHGLPPSADTRSAFCLWLAGPYRALQLGGATSKWLAGRGEDIASATRRLLAQDGGVQPIAPVRNEVAQLGVAEGQIDAWLAAHEARVEADTIVWLRGAPATVAERILTATGEAMTADELVAWTGETSERAGQWTAMLRRDRRFVEVSGGRYELAEWGSVPASLQGVELTTVHSAASIGESGSLRIAVDAHVLAGRTGEVPCELLERLGIRPGATRCIATRYGPLSLSSTAEGARRGSLRPVALAAGAAPGDVLVVRIDAGGTTAAVEIVAAEIAS